MKIENSPGAYGFLAGLIVLLLGLFANAGCAHAGAFGGRDVQERYEQAVQITATCTAADGTTSGFYGSGVIVSTHALLTAAHVASEPDGWRCTWEAEMSNGKKYAIHAGTVMHDYDLASMYVADGESFDPTYPVVFGDEPEYGARVCAQTSFPRPLIRCGEAQTKNDPPGNLTHTMLVEPGNSGSGVYDNDGRLVGIITHLFRCSNGQYCGGRMATLEGHVAELLRR